MNIADLTAYMAINAIVAMISAATAVFVGVKAREVGLRVYILVMITAILSAAAVIETWFTDSSLLKSATIGWIIGYITDDVLLTMNTLMPDFIRNTLDKILSGVSKKVDNVLGIDSNENKE